MPVVMTPMPTYYTEIAEEPLVPVPVVKFIEGISLPCDIFIQENNITISLFNKGILFDSSAKRMLREKGIGEVLIKAKEAAKLDRSLSKNTSPGASSLAAVVFKDYFHHKEQHFQIDRMLLIPETEIRFTIYLLSRSSLSVLVEASEKSPGRLEKSVESADGDLVIRKSDIPWYQAYLNDLLMSKALPPKEQSRIRSMAIKENSRLIVKDLIDNPRSGEKIKESIVAVNKMVDCILENKDAVYDLISIRTHDFYTYTHSVNVAALAVGLGIAVGLSRAELEKLGIGTLLHDLGKNAIPHEILNKPGRLTDDEFSVMKTHVLESEKILRVQKEIPEASYVALLQHHEKISGKGYPYGLSGQNVKVFGRISAIADCYDAMTTQRSYKPAFTPFHALSILVNENEHYDPELLAVFIKMLGKITS